MEAANSVFLHTRDMKTAHLSRNIKEIVQSLHAAGLTVVATVSDQYTTNTAAIKNLKEDKHFGYLIGDKEIVHIYYVPHLLKGLGNNMLDSEVHFKWKKDKVQVASWEHSIKLYELDVGPNHYKMCNRLTEADMYASKIEKMKVKVAAQVFSQRVSSVMRALVRLRKLNF